MKRIFGLLVLLAMAQGAWAEEKSIVQKTGDVLKKGAEATERGIKKGAQATERGIKKGAQATEHGVRKAGEWVGEKMQQGGEKLEKVSK